MRRMKSKLLLSLASAILLAGSLPAADVPRTAPDLQVRMAKGGDFPLNKYKGKVIALAFILTTCPHCQATCQALNKIYQDNGAKGFMPVAVAINEMANMYTDDFVKQFGITFPVGYGHRDTAMSFLQHPIMVSMMMPQLVLIDRQGVIRYQYAGNDPFFVGDQEKSMRTVIEGMLKGAGVSATPAPKKATPPVSTAKKTS
jgi:peroxiredoxin